MAIGRSIDTRRMRASLSVVLPVPGLLSSRGIAIVNQTVAEEFCARGLIPRINPRRSRAATPAFFLKRPLSSHDVFTRHCFRRRAYNACYSIALYLDELRSRVISLTVAAVVVICGAVIYHNKTHRLFMSGITYNIIISRYIRINYGLWLRRFIRTNYD